MALARAALRAALSIYHPAALPAVIGSAFVLDHTKKLNSKMPKNNKTPRTRTRAKNPPSTDRRKFVADIDTKLNLPSLMNSLMVSKPKKKKSRLPSSGNGSKKASGTISLSMPAAKYVAAMLNPWSSEATDAYIPIGNGRATQKIRNFQRFTAVVGTQNVGWVVFTPCLQSGGLLAQFTNAAYAGVSAVPYLTATPAVANVGVQNVLATTLYSFTDLTAPYLPGTAPPVGCFGRVVALGVTASYIGTTLDEGGLMYCYTDPDHNSVIGSTVASLGARGETEITNVSRQKCYMADYSLTEDEAVFDRTTDYAAVYAAANAVVPDTSVNAPIVPCYPFASGKFPGPASSGLSNFPPAFGGAQPTSIIMFTGTPGNSVFIDLVLHVEYQGVATEGKTTPSPIDRLGFEAVTASMGLAASKRCSRTGMDLASAFTQSLEEHHASTRPAPRSFVKSAVGM